MRGKSSSGTRAKVWFGVFLIAVSGSLVAAPMSNGDVVGLIKAGLSEETILLAIDAADPPQFDIGATGLVNLKKAGASDRLVQRVIAKQTAKPNSPTAQAAPSLPASPTAGGPCKSEVTGYEGRLVMRAGGKLLPLTYRKAQIQADGDVLSSLGSMVSFGLIKSKGTGSERIDGGKSQIRIQAGQPEFLDVMFPTSASPQDNFYLLKLNVQSGTSRTVVIARIEAGLTGSRSSSFDFPPDVRMPMQAEQVAANCTYQGKEWNMFRFKVSSPLIPAEYAILTGDVLFDFGVD